MYVFVIFEYFLSSLLSNQILVMILCLGSR